MCKAERICQPGTDAKTMARHAEISAGLLAFRRVRHAPTPPGARAAADATHPAATMPERSALEVLLAHPGGPYWAKRDAGAWTIPKGLVEAGADVLATAKRLAQ